jgi:hypothetical protein
VPLVTQPDLPALVVTVADVATRAGLDAADPATAAVVEAAIRDATADAEAYLGRPVTPQRITENHLAPSPHGWPLSVDPLIVIETVTAELDGAGQPTGLYTVTYQAGLNAVLPEYGPIRRWITASAAFTHPAVRRLVGTAGRVVQSVSAEGQSVSYAAAPDADRTPTAGVPAMATMDFWRVAGRRAYLRPN